MILKHWIANPSLHTIHPLSWHNNFEYTIFCFLLNLKIVFLLCHLLTLHWVNPFHFIQTYNTKHKHTNNLRYCELTKHKQKHKKKKKNASLCGFIEQFVTYFWYFDVFIVTCLFAKTSKVALWSSSSFNILCNSSFAEFSSVFPELSTLSLSLLSTTNIIPTIYLFVRLFFNFFYVSI